MVVFEPIAGVADAFRFAAAQFWCDAQAILERGYDAMLSSLRP